METKSLAYFEKLSRLVYYAALAVVAFLLLKYFGNVVAYIVTALVISLICKPIMGGMRKIRIKGKTVPDWLLAIICIVLIFLVLSALISGLVPVISSVVTDVVNASNRTGANGLSYYLNDFNKMLRDNFHLQKNFKIEIYTLDQLKSMLSINLFGNVVGSVAGTFASFCVGLFSVVFISFFFIKDDKLFVKFLDALTPDRLSEKVIAAQRDIEHLLSRYFVGLIIEMSCVGFIDFIGLWSVTGMSFKYALGIGFLAGMLNIVPYLGPVMGGALGSLMGIVLKYFSVGVVHADVGFWIYVLMLVCIFSAAQLVDNFVLQPLIYSTSIQARPLEIFIVLLIAGTVGGVLGMLVAIPAYTVVRVVAIRFFPDLKFIKLLTRQ